MFENEGVSDLRMASSGKIDLFLSKELKVNGGIGPCTSLKKHSASVSEVEIGEGNTVSWYIGGLDRCTTIAFYYDLCTPE